jgi:DNA-binding response OmpR family regulator
VSFLCVLCAFAVRIKWSEKVYERVLVIDDDPELLNMLKLGLETDGFTALTAHNGREGICKAYKYHPHVIVMDLMMDEMDGWTACRRLRDVCDTPIMILSARTAKMDIVRGLSMGADDYMTKPCSLNELGARVRALVRRSAKQAREAKAQTYDDGFLQIDFRGGTVRRQGEIVRLSPIETRLLLCMAAERGRIMPRKELLVKVWGEGYADASKHLSVYICYLRTKIERDPAHPQYICTRWKMGYIFAGE